MERGIILSRHLITQIERDGYRIRYEEYRLATARNRT